MVLESICKIIQDYMELQDGVVFVKDEKISMTKLKAFNVSVGFMSVKPIGTSRRMISAGQEQIGTTMAGQVAIDIYGRDYDVVERKEEIIQAMNSTACKEAQLTSGFMIASSPSSFNKVPDIDGASVLYRFQAIFNIQFIKTKTKTIDFYDQFRNEVKNG